MYSFTALHCAISAGSGKSFWYFDEDHPVRVWVYDRITTKTYDYIMIGIIFLNCIQMALESPYVEPGSTLDLAIYYSDIGYTIIFGLEVLIKSFAFTFRAYIKNVPNQVRDVAQRPCSTGTLV